MRAKTLRRTTVPETAQLAALRLGLNKFNCHVDFFWHANPHYSPHDTFFRVNVYQPFVDAHFPSVPRSGSFAARRLQNWHAKAFCGQWDWTVDFYACFLGDAFQFLAYLFKLVVVCAC
jgi:hypothetical protein